MKVFVSEEKRRVRNTVQDRREQAQFCASTSTTTEGVREILIMSIQLILFSVKTVWSGFILIIAPDFRADLLYRGNFNPGITWIEAARSRHVYRKIESSTHEQYVYPVSSCWPGSPELVAYESGCNTVARRTSIGCEQQARINRYIIYLYDYFSIPIYYLFIYSQDLSCVRVFFSDVKTPCPN